MSLIYHQPLALEKSRPKHGEILNRIERAQVRRGYAQGRTQTEMQRAYGCSGNTIFRAVHNMRNVKDNLAEDEAYLGGTKKLEDYEAELRWAPEAGVLAVSVDKPRGTQRHARKPRQRPYPTPASAPRSSGGRSRTSRSPVRDIIDEEVPQFLRNLGLTMRYHIRAMSALGIRTADDLAALKSTRDATLDVTLRPDAMPKGFKWIEWVKIVGALRA
ncbi:hypothetical protein EWM64_g498 [Hericium alpestre]|uniref:Uncharacterized protein n=1 Tax=Hericium alpestre TaxID=135208 RepID=A0A4Z0A8W1_9AGAM|nr:hypothetical protein EWM64_g498 [Hericium alpestre]